MSKVDPEIKANLTCESLSNGSNRGKVTIISDAFVRDDARVENSVGDIDRAGSPLSEVISGFLDGESRSTKRPAASAKGARSGPFWHVAFSFFLILSSFGMYPRSLSR
jgi:hypothetical protein